MKGNIILKRLVGRKVITYKIPLYLMPEAGNFVELTIKGNNAPFELTNLGEIGGQKCK